MGFRFRKSINLGGGFRINLSKSGIGYSFGTKGFRVTKKAKGGTRYTASIPGTGISYVEETGKKSQSRSNAENNHNCKSSVHSQPVEYEIKHCDTVELSNSNIDNVFSEGLEEMIASANRSYKYNRWSTIGIIVFLILSTAYPIFLLATCICVALKIYVLKNGKIELEYTIDEDQRAIIDERIKSFQKIAKSKNIEVQAHMKIDTGFGRYGFLHNNQNDILEAFKMCEHLKIIGTYTHFARPIDEKFTNLQFDRFLEVIKFLKTQNQNPGMLHCSESTAFLKYPMMNLNAVRIGSLLQGRTLVHVPYLQKIGEFKTAVQEIKTVPKGYNISYGKMYKTKRETKIAILPVGYMDGFNMRKDRDIFSFKENFLSVGIEIKKFFKDNSLKVTIKGKKYNIIGRIGMYHSVVDITGSDDVFVNDEVEILVPPMQVNSMIRREYL